MLQKKRLYIKFETYFNSIYSSLGYQLYTPSSLLKKEKNKTFFHCRWEEYGILGLPFKYEMDFITLIVGVLY